MGEPSVLKRFLSLKLFSLENLTSSAISLDIKTEADYLDGLLFTQASVTLTDEGYGNSAYGTSPYGNPSELVKKIKLKGGRQRALKIIFENTTAQQNAVITGWEIEVATPFRAEMKK